MDKKYSIIFLIFISISIVILILISNQITKEDINIEDISGNKSALGDMNIVYNRQMGMYETDQIVISKNKNQIKKYTKEEDEKFPISKNNIENRELLKLINNKSEICDNEDEICTISILDVYSIHNQNKMAVCINIKNKKDNSVKKYEIKIDDQIQKERVYKVLPIKDKNNIYLAIISSVYDKNLLEDENKLDKYKQTYLSLYKLNLESKKSKSIINKSYESNEIYTDGKVGFVKDKVAYFVVNMKDKEDERMKTCLFAFDIISMKIKIIDLKIGRDKITDYYINNDEALLSCKIDKDKRLVNTLIVDLNENKIKSTHKINIRSIREYDREVIQMREYKNKIYLILGDSRYKDNISYNSEFPNVYYYIYIIDRKSDNILYNGKIKENYINNINFGLLTKDEL